jgi:outer membrane protein OmpA-like peptidoglycan-associated protein
MTGSREGAATGAAIGAVGGAVAGNVWSKKMQAQKEQMEAATEGTGVTVSQTDDNRLKLDIPSDISFDTNRYDIKPDFRPILDEFARTLQDNPGTQVTIIGHTDSTGNDAINNPLSVNRAAATRDYLTARGVGHARVSIDGRGSHEPIASNDTVDGRARNRRVEIFVAEPQTAVN